jgi:hypothetical protein
MTATFKIGDRVRLRASLGHPGYRPGDTGTIKAVIPSPTSGGEPLYLVDIDQDERPLCPAFYADELELVK